MKAKWLVGLMGLLLVLGFGVPASADWVADEGGCGDGLSAIGVDIERAKVEVFPDSSNPDYEPWIYLCVDMCDENGLPGMLVWEFDADSNTATGAGTMLEMPFDPCPVLDPGPPKVQRCKDMDGIDIVIQKWFRRQDDTSQTAWCKGCDGVGASTCAKKNAGTAETCGADTCYEILEFCATDTNPDCKEIGANCTGSASCEEKHPFDTNPQCSAGPCGRGARRGDYQVVINDIGGVFTIGGIMVDWGRTTPAKEVGAPGDCEKLPWGQIVREAKAKGAEFDDVAALANPPKWQVSTWHDPTFGDDGDDFFEDYDLGWGNQSIHVNDWMPDTDFTFAAGQSSDGGVCHELQKKFHCCLDEMAEGAIFTPYSVCSGYDQTECEADDGCTWRGSSCLSNACLMEASGDGKITAPDYAIFKKEFGRAGCPCSN